MHLIIPDHVPDCRGNGHNLECRHYVSIHCRNQLLRNNGIEHHGKLYSDLPLLIRRKYINNTVDGICGADGVQGREKQMPDVYKRQGKARSYEAPHGRLK